VVRGVVPRPIVPARTRVDTQPYTEVSTRRDVSDAGDCSGEPCDGPWCSEPRDSAQPGTGERRTQHDDAALAGNEGARDEQQAGGESSARNQEAISTRS
jgi:hypothetical protein